MGTGTYQPASGSAGSGVRGGMTFGGGAGGSVVRNSKIKKQETCDEAMKIMAALPREFLISYFCSPAIEFVYNSIFEISTHLIQNRSWDGLANRFGIEDTNGCLIRLIQQIKTQSHLLDNSGAVQNLISFCLDRFILRTVRGDKKILVRASGDEVMRSLDHDVFKKTSGHFLGIMCAYVLREQIESLASPKQQQIDDFAQRLADRLVAKFHHKFHGESQTTYRDFFKVARKNEEWLIQQLRANP